MENRSNWKKDAARLSQIKGIIGIPSSLINKLTDIPSKKIDAFLSGHVDLHRSEKDELRNSIAYLRDIQLRYLKCDCSNPWLSEDEVEHD